MGNYEGHDWSNWRFERDIPLSNFSKCSFKGAIGSGKIFNSSNFTKADLTRCSMVTTKMENCDFINAKLVKGDFRLASLYRSRFENADVSQALLCEANLTEASFDRANLSGTDFRRADLTSAEFRGVDLSVSKGLTQEQLDSAKGDSSVILPEGLTRPAHWQDLAPPDDES